jgi:hypothetical protein
MFDGMSGLDLILSGSPIAEWFGGALVFLAALFLFGFILRTMARLFYNVPRYHTGGYLSRPGYGDNVVSNLDNVGRAMMDVDGFGDESGGHYDGGGIGGL